MDNVITFMAMAGAAGITAFFGLEPPYQVGAALMVGGFVLIIIS